MSALRGLSIDWEIAIREEIARRERGVPASRPDITTILPLIPDIGKEDTVDHREPLYLPVSEEPIPGYEPPKPDAPKRGGMEFLRY